MKLAILAFAAAVAAIPISNNGTDIALAHDEAIVVLGNGEMHMMKQSEVDDFAENLNIDTGAKAAQDILAPEQVASDITDTEVSDSSDSNAKLQRRRSHSIELIVPRPDQTFQDWDLAMSSVVYANKRDARVSIISGQSIANAISGGGGATLKLIPDFLDLNGKVDYSHTKTATVSGTIMMTIPKGNYGAVVSRPWTHRRKGRVWNGAPGHAKASYWQADSHTDAEFHLAGGNLKWVAGVITTCLGHKYPLPMCHGKGVLH